LPRQNLQAYIGLELFVALFALLLRSSFRALTPLLRGAYADAAPGLLFPAVRLVSCLAMVFVPAVALGATFPVAVRWFTHRTANAARVSGALYAMNTVGAAIGSLLAGFTLIPAVGISGTTRVGMFASVLAAALVADRCLPDARRRDGPVDAGRDIGSQEARSQGRAKQAGSGRDEGAAVAGYRRSRPVRILCTRSRDSLDPNPGARAGTDHLRVCRNACGGRRRRRHRFGRRHLAGRPDSREPRTPAGWRSCLPRQP
jgi:hypothetical protein